MIVTWGIVVGTLRVSPDGRGWLSLSARSHRARYVARAIVFVAAMVAVWVVVPGAKWVLTVAGAVVVLVGVAAVQHPAALARRRAGDRAVPNIPDDAFTIGDLATVPGASPAVVLQLVDSVQRWADSHGITLRAEARPDRAGQYSRLFGMQSFGETRNAVSGTLVVLVRRPYCR